MSTIEICCQHPYKVLIGNNIISSVGSLINDIKSYKRAVIISDDIVMPLYGNAVRESLWDAEIKWEEFVFKNGEHSKSIDNLQKIYEFLIFKQIMRGDVIIALGGGVVGDIAGFAAATFLRGIDFVQIPTTLIAQTDSSVGGKTAINIGDVKNMVGAFYQPKLVICDTDTLNTLETNVFNEAACEVIKYALLADEELFDILENGNIKANINYIIEKCVKIKADIVSRDEFDRGERMLLNLGHTVGHAIEASSGFDVSHGKAVGIGMAVMLKACVKNGILDETVYQRFLNVLAKFDIDNTYDGASLNELIELMLLDKKRENDSTNIIICSDVGHCAIKKIENSKLYDFLS